MFYDNYIAQPPLWFIVMFIVLMLWEMLWKGISLWTAGKLKQKGWFIAIFFLNTLGVLPIIYLAFFQKKEEEKDLAQLVRVHEESLKAQQLNKRNPRKRIAKKKK